MKEQILETIKLRIRQENPDVAIFEENELLEDQKNDFYKHTFILKTETLLSTFFIKNKRYFIKSNNISLLEIEHSLHMAVVALNND